MRGRNAKENEGSDLYRDARYMYGITVFVLAMRMCRSVRTGVYVRSEVYVRSICAVHVRSMYGKCMHYVWECMTGCCMAGCV